MQGRRGLDFGGLDGEKLDVKKETDKKRKDRRKALTQINDECVYTMCALGTAVRTARVAYKSENSKFHFYLTHHFVAAAHVLLLNRARQHAPLHAPPRRDAGGHGDG